MLNFDTTTNIFKSHYPQLNIPKNQTLSEFVLDTPFKNHGLDHPVFSNAATDEFITHQDLRDYIPKLASGFYHNFSIREGDVVAIFSPNHIHYATCMLAVTSLGGILSPINYVYTSGEVKHLLTQVNPKVLLTIPELYETAQKALQTEGLKNCQIVFLNSEPCPNYSQIPGLNQITHNSSCQQIKFTNPNQSQQQTAAILFSSGTTGIPKGVKLSHYNLIANLMQVEHGLKSFYSPKQKFIAVLPFFHCYAMMTDMLSIVHNLCSTKLLQKFDLPKFLDIIQSDNIENTFVAPPIILGIAKHPIVKNYDLSKLKCLFSGAAPLSKDLEFEIRQKFGIKCAQGYGMSEMSPVSHILQVQHNQPGSIGHIVANMEAKIKDVDSGKLLGPNQRGELWMKGPNVMLGYYKNPKVTKEMFDSDGFMRTGDIAYCNDEGFFFIVDRLKELIKVKGFQVPPAELEALLLTHPKVADACVIGVKIDKDTEAPKGYITLKDPKASNHSEIIGEVKHFLHSKVAHYKQLTGGLEIIAQIPKSASGKILRRELAKLNESKSKL